MPSGTKGQPQSNKEWFLRGLKNAVPINLGYLAVAFAIGIAARNAGMNALQSGLMSATMLASAGQFALISLIDNGAGYFEIVTTSLIVNLRYLLMSCSLTQKLSEKTEKIHRFLIPLGITDEIYALSVTVEGGLNPFYTYGMTVCAAPGWILGTVLGVLVGNILPPSVSGALVVLMYGMFLAIVIPPIKKNHFIGLLVGASMLLSWLFSITPVLKELSSGFKVIILTVALSAAAAALKPVDETGKEETGRGLAS